MVTLPELEVKFRLLIVVDPFCNVLRFPAVGAVVEKKTSVFEPGGFRRAVLLVADVYQLPAAAQLVLVVPPHHAWAGGPTVR
jgi:hypothetical protein